MAPRRYVCPRVVPIQIKGDLSDPGWAKAPWTEDFVDILGDRAPKPRFRTRAKMAWDDANLYIAAEMEEPQVWGTLTEHDSVIFQDNDFEVFLDPDGDHHLYAEFEINALNTFWDLLLVRPYRDGGPAVNGWEIKGIRTAVHVNGTINNPSDIDQGWTVEIAIPFAALAEIATCPCPPRVGDQWRINFSRVEWETDVVDGRYVKCKKPEDNWVWSPQGVIDMHQPEHWGYLVFGKDHGRSDEEKMALAACYHAQRAYRGAHGRWAKSVSDLSGDLDPKIQMEVTTHLFEARLGKWRIDQDSRLRPLE